MDNIVYVLGAGFSAPLDLPVMGDFIQKAHDLDTELAKSEAFIYALQVRRQLSEIKNYYDSDLFNIEEVLSILETESLVNEEVDMSKFINFIKIVVDAYTPSFMGNWTQCDDWQQCIFNTSKPRFETLYCYFLLRLCHKTPTFRGDHGRAVPAFRRAKPCGSYSVISLNYDMVLENSKRLLERGYDVSIADHLKPTSKWDEVPLLKLHGCSGAGTIVPPTWKKGSHPELIDSWKRAHEALRCAQHIRFIGFSLPPTDSYLPYLFKSAARDCEYLKNIDVICLDDKVGSVQSRFRNFIPFKNFRFRNGRTEDYLRHVFPVSVSKFRENNVVVGDQILLEDFESRHDGFMMQGA